MDPMARIPRSGTRIDLEADGTTASIASIGASLRSLRAGGRDLVVPFDADDVRPSFRGTTLAPWPNRVIGGRYRFRGIERQLALTEPSRGHALHGLAAWRDWRVVDADASSVELALEIEPSDGYPWRLDVRTTYAIVGGALTQRVRVESLDDEAAPWGTGPHPYLVAGPSPLEAWTLELPASAVQTVTDERLVPIALEDVAIDTERFDFRRARTLGDVRIDHAFTRLTRDEEGMATVVVRDPGGSGVAVRWDDACPWVQIHTADLPGEDRALGHRAGLAVEPMTCAPGALDEDLLGYEAGLVTLEPGAVHEASWTIAAA